MKNISLLFVFLFLSYFLNAQKNTEWYSNNIFKTDCFIENKGQFDSIQHHVKNVQFAVDNGLDKIYFTKTGLSYLIYKKVEKENFNKNLKTEPINEIESFEENENKSNIETDYIDLEWQNTNPNVIIETSGKTKHYFTYGEDKYTSYGYETITYKNLYPNIDLQYSLNEKSGIEYKLLLHSGADLKQVRYKYIAKDIKIIYKNDSIKIENEIGGICEKTLIAFYKKDKKKLN